MNGDKPLATLSDTELKEAFTGVISAKMAKADWYYEYSDDPSVSRSGSLVIGGIKDDLKLLARLDGGLEEAQKLWVQYVPPHSIGEPSFFSKPAQLSRILDGMLMKEDVPAVQAILQDQQQNGNRFVAFDSDPLVLPEKRFTGFPSAIGAKHFAYENSTLEETYVVHSISSMQKELQRALEPDKEHALKEIRECLQQHQQEEKRSRGQDLSR